MKSRGSYAPQWKLIEGLKRDGIAVYDLNGINPEKNPGTFKFKDDLAGKNGSDVRFLGWFDSRGRAASAMCVQGGELLRIGLSRAEREGKPGNCGPRTRSVPECQVRGALGSQGVAIHFGAVLEESCRIDPGASY